MYEQNNSPAPIRVPVPTPSAAVGSPAQVAFRQAIQDVENLRDQVQALRIAQAEGRRRYWQQVGPVAAAVVAARRALFAPLEDALLLNYFSRKEEGQITEFILENARAIQERFGEDEADIIQKHSPKVRPVPAQESAPPLSEPQAETTRRQRPTKAQRAAEATTEAARAEQQRLATSAKTVYRQLARIHHPDLARTPETQVEKTAQMQQIVAAYEADDLFGLLQLLADSGPTDADADDVLSRYTQALAQQQRTLKLELQNLKYGPQGNGGSSGKRQEQELRQLKRDLRDEAAYVAHAAQLITDPEELRDLLRELAAAGRESI